MTLSKDLTWGMGVLRDTSRYEDTNFGFWQDVFGEKSLTHEDSWKVCPVENCCNLYTSLSGHPTLNVSRFTELLK